MSNNFYTHFEMEWDHILLSYYKNGVKHNDKIKLKPYLFIPSALDSEYQTYNGKNVQRIDFDSCREAREFVKSYEGVPNFQIYGLPMHQYVYIYEKYKTIEFDRDQLKILNFDIEYDSTTGYSEENQATKEINAITMRIMGSKEIYTLGLQEYQTKEQELLDLIDQGWKINYKHCKDERELLHFFIEIWKKLAPDVVTGWNIKIFDIPYIIKRIVFLFDEAKANELSPFKKLKHSTVTIFNKEKDIFEIVGIPTLDYIEVYKKFSQGVEESYSLDYLSGKLIGKKKLEYKEEYGSLAGLQKGNWNKYIDYNIIDVIRVEEIDQVVSFMDIAFEIAYETKTNYTDCFGTIRVWDAMIHNYLMDRKIVVPYVTFGRKERSIAGGHVKVPQVGKHKWVMSFDFKSLYPHLCMTFNISPDTYLGTFQPIVGMMSVEKILDGQLDRYHQQMLKQNVTITGCGTVFTRNKQGFVPAIMERLFKLRAEHAKEEDKYTKIYAETHDKEAGKLANIFANKSYAIKILLNSGYGALSNEFYRFFSDYVAESFTLSGQLSVRTVEKFVNMRLNEHLGTKDVDYIVAIDTDSIYIKMDDLVERFAGDQNPVDFLEEFSDTVQQWIQEGLEHLYVQTNAFEKKLFMAIEAIGPAIWIAKKRYVMSLPSFKKVRYDPPKIKIQGIEAVRSTTPKIVREWIKAAIPIALKDGSDAEIKKFINDCWETYMTLDFDQIAMPKGTNDLETYSDKQKIYGPKTPIHVRGALLFNDYVKKNGWSNEIESLKSGDKVKYTYLILPNPLMENVISTPEDVPNQFKEFYDYVDFETQFDKSFLDPLKRITGAAGINISDDIDIDQFFM